VGHNCYIFIIGYHRTGKTTLVSNVSNKLRDIIYIDILPGTTSEERFANLSGTGLKWTTPRRH